MQETLGFVLRKLRLERGLPIRKVAARVDVDQSTMGKFERGERLPKEELLPKLAKFFDMELDELTKIYKSDKILFQLLEETNPRELLKITEEKLQYALSKNLRQGEIF